MGRVFVVQMITRYAEKEKLHIPKYDITQAEEFGEVVVLLPPTASPFTPNEFIEDIWEALSDFNDDDFLLCMGSPVWGALAGYVAGCVNQGRVNFLQYNQRERIYRETGIIDICGEEPENEEEET